MKKLFKVIAPFKYQYLFICLIGVVLAALDMIPPRLVGNAVNLMSSKSGFEMSTVLKIVGLWAVAAFATQALHGYQIFVASKTGEKVITSIRQIIFDRLQKVSMGFFDQNHIGRFYQAFGSDLDSLRSVATWGFNTVTSNSAFMIFSAVMIARTDSKMFLATVWLAPAMTLLNFIYGKLISRSWQNIRKDSARVNGNQAENIAGAKVVAAFNRQQENLTEFNELQDLNTANQLRLSRQNGIFQPAMQWVRFLGRAIVLIYGGYRVVSGQLQTGDLVAVSLYWEWFMMPAVNFGSFFNELVVARTGADRVLEIIDQDVVASDCEGAYDLPRVKGAVKFEGVNFSYIPGKPVLKNASFEIPGGTTVALVGATGSGKTTLLSLLTRFYDPQEGSIYLDGHNIQKVTSKSLHKNLALVLQNNFLFSGTIIENIRYDRIDITDEQIFAATKALGCHNRVLALKNGYQTQVGESGNNLSLGERQLICFSRALVRNPSLLLLDEATSALDPDSDAHVRKALRELSSERTTFIVTHRLRTAVEADLVLMLESGFIAEKGSHEELLALNGSYAKLFKDSLRSSRNGGENAVFEESQPALQSS